MKKSGVTIVIPTKNSASFLRSCLAAIRKQTYKNIEIILVDGYSTDQTIAIGKEYKAKIIEYDPHVPEHFFDAPHRRNFGISKASGEYVYFMDADMELTSRVVESCVKLCKEGADAVIISEDSFGQGIWARAKNLERMCYWGDDTVEAPRFVKKSVWDSIGGLDTSLGGGGDDWDLHAKLNEKGYRVERSPYLVRHNEGHLTLGKLFRKRFMYGRDSMLYIAKRPQKAVQSYFPIRKAYIIHWRLFVSRPVDAVAFLIMRTVEYSAGFLGILLTLGKRA